MKALRALTLFTFTIASLTVDDLGANSIVCLLPAFLGGTIDPGRLVSGASAPLLLDGALPGVGGSGQLGSVNAFGLGTNQLVVTATAECGWLLLALPAVSLGAAQADGAEGGQGLASADGADAADTGAALSDSESRQLYSCGSTQLELPQELRQQLTSPGEGDAAAPSLALTVRVRMARLGTAEAGASPCSALGPEVLITRRLELRPPSLPSEAITQRWAESSKATAAGDEAQLLSAAVAPEGFDLVTTASLQVRVGEEEQLVVRQLRGSGDVLDASLQAYNVSYPLAGLRLPATTQSGDGSSTTGSSSHASRCEAAAAAQAELLAAALGLPAANVTVTCSAAEAAAQQGLMVVAPPPAADADTAGSDSAGGARAATAALVSAADAAAAAFAAASAFASATCPGGRAAQQTQSEQTAAAGVALVALSFLLSPDVDPRAFAATARRLLTPLASSQAQAQVLQAQQAQPLAVFMCQTPAARLSTAADLGAGAATTSAYAATDGADDLQGADILSVLALRMRVDVAGGSWSVAAGGGLTLRSGGPAAGAIGPAGSGKLQLPGAGGSSSGSGSGSGSSSEGVTLELGVESLAARGGLVGPGAGGSGSGSAGSGAGGAVTAPVLNPEGVAPGGGAGSPPAGSSPPPGKASPPPGVGPLVGAGAAGSSADSGISTTILGVVAGASAAATLLLVALLALVMRKYKAHRTQLYLSTIDKPIGKGARSRGASSAGDGLSRSASTGSMNRAPGAATLPRATVAFTLDPADAGDAGSPGAIVSAAAVAAGAGGGGSGSDGYSHLPPHAYAAAAAALAAAASPPPPPPPPPPPGQASLATQSSFMQSALRRLISISSIPSVPSAGDLSALEMLALEAGEQRMSGGGGAVVVTDSAPLSPPMPPPLRPLSVSPAGARGAGAAASGGVGGTGAGAGAGAGAAGSYCSSPVAVPAPARAEVALVMGPAAAAGAGAARFGASSAGAREGSGGGGAAADGVPPITSITLGPEVATTSITLGPQLAAARAPGSRPRAAPPAAAAVLGSHWQPQQPRSQSPRVATPAQQQLQRRSAQMSAPSSPSILLPPPPSPPAAPVRHLPPVLPEPQPMVASAVLPSTRPRATEEFTMVINPLAAAAQLQD
ncbi:hypothetical protein HXX76_000474 [Chlamydomonas incerta]|uniref:Uncharacterized protein n=1 Tax=Chlamydomonas incerta TaxID=51695 RepID=A0A835WEC0_CHLIN|nr:hypothetical protein HXX76_000474 [Chlamydomonas incerta]|eukprot:KAG2445870.1 hypothetical protein HXX76_000474 [Chlamydomonas incerta]